MQVIAFAIFSILIISSTSVVPEPFNMVKYAKIPPLYDFEDYDNCLLAGSSYCMVYAEIMENHSSTLWLQIEHISAQYKQHYRHDRLFFGVCMNNCQNVYNSLSEVDILKHHTDVIPSNNELMNQYAKIHLKNQQQYYNNNYYINICLNRNFQLNYNLSLGTTIEYCVDQKIEHSTHDELDLTVYIILATLVILNVSSTLYDFRLNRSQPNPVNSFYQKKLSKSTHILLTSFSVCRNYYRVVTIGNNQLETDFRFIDAYRVFSVFFVILAHTILMYMAVPIQNPQFFEQLYYSTETAIIQNGAVIIQIFFVISGFLLYMNFKTRELVTIDMPVKNCLSMYLKIFLYRYFRIAPSLLALVLFNGTLLIRLQNGPFWWHINAAERSFCRSYWWQNMLLINNYLMKESCAHQTWYLAADMQLFELFLILLILMTKLPKLRKIMFWWILVLSVLIPATITYVYRLEAVYHSFPESYRYLYFKDAETFYKVYTPFYNNLAGYLFGISSAYIYVHTTAIVQTHFKNHLAYKIGWWCLFPAAFGLLFLADAIVAYNFPKPSISVAVFSGFFRLVWVLICTLALLGMSFKMGGVALNFARMKIFHVLSRLSYQSFLWHVVVLRLLSGYIRQPIYINRFFMISQVLLSFTLTQILAFLWVIIFEYPIAVFVKYIFNKFDKSQKDTKSTREVETFHMETNN